TRRRGRRDRRGHGRGRPREHRKPAAVRGSSWHGARRGGDPAGRVTRRDVRGGRRPGPQGQGEPRARVAGRARGGRSRRPQPERGARGALRGAGRRAAPHQGDVHATGRDGKARLVSILGPAGIGKSRLAWEFLKYVDGLVETLYWHDGRSPAYGEGITFWALGEMIRG